MTTPIAPIASIAPFVPFAATPAAATSATAGAGFSEALGAALQTGEGTLNLGSALANGFDAVQAAQHSADTLSVAAATGQLVDPAQLTIASTKAQLMTQVATAIQSKAVTAFNTIMSMQA